VPVSPRPVHPLERERLRDKRIKEIWHILEGILRLRGIYCAFHLLKTNSRRLSDPSALQHSRIETLASFTIFRPGTGLSDKDLFDNTLRYRPVSSQL